MNTFAPPDTLHRLVKEALDSGEAASLSEANELFKGFRIGIELDDGLAGDEASQIALLTAVALASRVYLGGVVVKCPAMEPLSARLPLGSTLGDAVVALGGELGEVDHNLPIVSVGNKPVQQKARFHVRTAFTGWRAGILPAHSQIAMDHKKALPPAAVLAAALAINEAFLFTRTASSSLGRRPVGISLWSPSSRSDWLSPSSDGPELFYLPSQLWLVGLGHLGQAYLWVLGTLPYSGSDQLSLVLQDYDIITPSTESTSVLTDRKLIGQKKTRAMAAWAEKRGFATNIVERRFDENFKRQPEEPPIVLSGVDNAVARRKLDQVGFDLIVDAGLGRGYRDYRTMRLHTLPGSRPASAIWNSSDPSENVESRPGYQKLLNDKDLDRCGVTLLAGKAVGAPFVGSAAACLAISEILRLLHGGPVHDVIDLDLQSVDQRTAVVHPSSFASFNPGYVAVAR
jgi:hypothetical protein